ncbi:TetR/AcrR family transcriptional regulator C-terminal domain-containing protein [Pseudoxanthomonas winnipegensis]|nr:TetR/AcrR family transcriptional regulator C-terminal domain-containing protein [Pseudoxanthomonas winnipegensis]
MAVKRGRGIRAGLDLQLIVATAKGIDPAELSMQSIADALGVDRKALHKHVRDKETLLGLVAHDALADVFTSTDLAAAQDWRQACRLFAQGFVRAVVGLGALAEYLWFGEAEFGDWPTASAEALLGHLARAGFSDAAAVRFIVVLTTLCLGHARDVIQYRESRDQLRPRQRQVRNWLEKVQPEHYPHLVRIAELGLDTYGAEQLQFSVDLLVRGAEHLLVER